MKNNSVIAFLVLFQFMAFSEARGMDQAYDPLNVFGSQDRSFSAFVMDCKDKTTLLDYHELYEIESNYKYDIKYSTKNDILDELFTRFEKISKPRADMFKFWRNHFEAEVKYVRNVNFGPIIDEFDFTVREGCEIKTLFKALNPTLRGKGIFVELNLWEKLDIQSQAGAIFNYLINLDYIYLLKKNLTVYPRYLNGFLASNRASSIKTFKERIQFLYTLGYEYIYKDGLFFELSIYNGTLNLKVDENDEIVSGRTASAPISNMGLGYENEIKIENVNGMVVSGPLSRSFKVDENRNIRLFDVQVRSPCIGKYSVANFTELKTIDLVYSKGKFYFKSLFTYDLLHNGQDLCRIKYEDGELILIENDCGYSSSSSGAQEIGMCGE